MNYTLSRNSCRNWVIGCLLLGLSACTTTPERVAELEQARSTVTSLENQPEAQSAASIQLRNAREALERADTAFENGESVDLIRHEAYVARRNAEIGLEMTSEARAREELSQAEARRNQVQLEARTVEAERSQMVAEQRATEAEAAQSEAQAATAEASRLAQELSELEAQQTERGLVLTLGDVLFDTDGSELKEGAEVSMDRLAEFMSENPERRLLVEGHTDSRGADDYNEELSEERAESVTEALVERGVQSERLRSVGLGESYPRASNNTPAGMQQNRRVEIVISNPDGTFPDSAEQRTTASRQG